MSSQRTILFPLRVGAAALAGRLRAVACALAEGDQGAFKSALIRLEERCAGFAAHRQAAATISAPGEAAVSGRVDPTRAAPDLRAQALAYTLADLVNNGWEVSFEGVELFVQAPPWDGGDANSRDLKEAKRRIRESVRPRRLEQLNSGSMRAFIERMEQPDGDRRSVVELIADGPALAAAIASRGPSAIKPTLEVAAGDSGDDPHTGLRRADIYRYFRGFWSFPSETTPGRRLPILVRDAGQPGHPVCGLLSLSSPVPRLSARDAHLGWHPAWLEAIIAGLLAPRWPVDDRLRRVALREHFEQLAAALTWQQQRGQTLLSAAHVMGDLATLLGLEGERREPRALLAGLAPLGAEALQARFRDAQRRVAAELVDEVEAMTTPYWTDALRAWVADAEDDDEVIARLEQRSAEAHEARRELIRQHQALSSEQRRERDELLFQKKRARKLAQALKAHADLTELRAALGEDAPSEQLAVALRRAAFNEQARSDALPSLRGGDGVSAGLRAALFERQTRLISAQVADISVCGAISPYRELLGGKLISLLALSREVAALYHESYKGQVSAIQSRMEGEEVVKPSALMALTTTSFYSVGSAQYNRVALPAALGGLRWREIGETRGHGTMHFSPRTIATLDALQLAIGEGRNVNAVFGEGPSERLRKLRDGFALLGLPADELLQHGVTRPIYLAELSPATRPGMGGETPLHHERGPSVTQISTFWCQRWAAPRLKGGERLERVRQRRRGDRLLSHELSAEAPSAGASARPHPQPDHTFQGHDMELR